MKVALVHDWLTGMRGGERVLEAILEVFPVADLYTLLHIKGSVNPEIEARVKGVSFIQRFPFLKDYYRYYLPLFPRAIEGFELSGYDLVISTSHCVAKGVKPGKEACHISYIFSPMRYVWDLHDEYFRNGQGRVFSRWGMRLWRNYLKEWDVNSSNRVNYFIADSRNVAAKIKRYYGRNAEVMYPPVDIGFFYPEDPSPSPLPKGEGIFKAEDCYLMVTALVPYKRVDVAINAFSRLGKKLVIIGSGPEEKKLKSMAGKDIEFLGWQPREVVRDYYRRCRAFIMPGEEDFGIAPVEAMACGRPVIAYGKGGAVETVSASTGLLYENPGIDGLVNAVKRFETIESSFDPGTIRSNALKFDRTVFKEKFQDFVRTHAQET